MIAIVNRSRKGAETCRYTLHINDQHICTFTHKRSDGLAECLRKAAEAVERDRNEMILKFLKG